MPILLDPEQIVLDTSALLAYMADEAGAEVVEIVLRAALAGKVEVLLPAICATEALLTALPTLDPDGLDDFRAAVDQLPVVPVPLDLDSALDVAVAANVWQMGYPEAAAAIAAGKPRSFVLTANPLFVWYERAGGRVYWIGPEAHRNQPTLFDPLARFRAMG